ncbi:hypothetical protein SAMN05421841_3533 [Chryseobacterium wanjuense]|uniref:Uncharacterized protein n=1 Tax=Chryseobacterium wanjuense TaxID=356305 RepID=A0A1I0S030_9FLAO|nr:hypothetical protein [Chryseobacterium wanjuense]SEW47469.1 hypothetical protein SAMN05421841_3533 [Chryseobacterium wanjuense]
MKKSLLLGALLVAGIVSAFPFRTSCGKVVQVSQTIADNMSLDQLSNFLADVNGENCPNAGAVVIHIYYH